jgi:tetratricopeptide (TPR) repeat protein
MPFWVLQQASWARKDLCLIFPHRDNIQAMTAWPLLLCLWTPLLVGPQDPVSRPTTRKHDLARVEALLQQWLDKEQRSDELRTKVVNAVAEVGAKAIQHLARQVSKAREGTDHAKARALESVICHVGLHWLEVVKKSKMIYAGQYQVLEHLQPTVGEFYLGLLIATPNWFPDTRRIEVVPAIRDLYPKSPNNAIQAQVKEIAQNEAIEPLSLRIALRYTLAQWGDRSLVKDHIHELTERAHSKDAETSILALKELADVHYQMRDYLTASRTHKEFLTKVEAEDYYVVPADYYNAACCMSLSGNLVSALDLLERCLKLNTSDRVDESVKLSRNLFDNDPELRAVRKSERFQKLVAAAFPKSGAKKGDKKTGRDRKKDR